MLDDIHYSLDMYGFMKNWGNVYFIMLKIKCKIVLFDRIMYSFEFNKWLKVGMVEDMYVFVKKTWGNMVKIKRKMYYFLHFLHFLPDYVLF